MGERTWEKHSSAVIAEHRLQSVFDSMKAMLEQFTSSELLADASLAYEAGLTSGFYGCRSVIAVASRMRITARYRQLKRSTEDNSYRSLLRRIRYIGSAHGLLIRNRRWDDCEGAAQMPRNDGSIIQAWLIGQLE
ncbi:hypothetical protein [Burkholderia seminalis]|uniref:hypothetical protein n=1 Tax=Burkholderia seminalis TaxID=488731 RepID=UPI002651EA1F|nr:hypothetical protein [Burkholderia seminalis]MDN7592076.1 hypothetical protein [Burkholderia seminalis]